MQALLRFLENESGSTAVEYGLLATIISVIAIGSMIAMGGSLRGFFEAMVAGLIL